MSDHAWIFALAGIAWVIGGILQWLTLRKQERLIMEVRRQRLWLLDSEDWNRGARETPSRHVRSGQTWSE